MTAATLSPADLAVDRQLAEVCAGFRFLLDVTPTNTDDARAEFLDGTAETPTFAYRQLEDDPEVRAAELASIDVDGVEDATVAHLAQAKRRELELQLALLGARGTDDFLPLSIELYGTVTPALLEQAEHLIARLADAPDGEDVDAEALARLAQQELDHYRTLHADLSSQVQVREECSGVLVVAGDLLIGPSTCVPASRAAALIQHEVGTHVLTFLNGCAQPLRLLGTGLAGFEETQEGLALIAEHLAGGLTIGRLRQLASRVIAVHGLVEGHSFREVHEDLVQRGFGTGGAFTTTMRVFRSGGLTKDMIYLRGLTELVQHIRDVEDLESLWLGKMSLADVPLVVQLRERGVLREPLLRPRYMETPDVEERLRALTSATDVLQLAEVKA